MPDATPAPTEVLDQFDDARRFVAGRLSGLFRIGLELDAAVEDLKGSATLGRYDCASLLGRRVVYLALSLVSATQAGTVSQTNSSMVFHDVFAGLDEAAVERGLRIACPPSEMSLAAYATWVEEIDRFVEHCQLESGAHLPAIRTAEGMLPALSIARDWLNLGLQLGVHPAPFMS